MKLKRHIAVSRQYWDPLNYFDRMFILVNIADSKQRVFRQNPDDWFSGYHNISWDMDAAELQNNDTIDIYLFSLIVSIFLYM